MHLKHVIIRKNAINFLWLQIQKKKEKRKNVIPSAQSSCLHRPGRGKCVTIMCNFYFYFFVSNNHVLFLLTISVNRQQIYSLQYCQSVVSNMGVQHNTPPPKKC